MIANEQKTHTEFVLLNENLLRKMSIRPFSILFTLDSARSFSRFTRARDWMPFDNARRSQLHAPTRPFLDAKVWETLRCDVGLYIRDGIIANVSLEVI